MEKKQQVKICNFIYVNHIKGFYICKPYKGIIVYNTKNIMNIPNTIRFICPSLVLGWTLLGFYRGQHNYNYNYYKVLYKFETYSYSHKLLHGLTGMVIYSSPIFIFVTIPKEIYRLEVNIRNLEHEKNTDYYNKLL